MPSVKPEELPSAVLAVLEQYNTKVVDQTRNAVQETMKELVAKTRSTAPKKKIQTRAAGTFARHITSKVGTKTITGYSEIWYVKSPEYRLAHLLNNGHALRQGGRWEGTGFISTAADEARSRLEEKLATSVKEP